MHTTSLVFYTTSLLSPRCIAYEVLMRKKERKKGL